VKLRSADPLDDPERLIRRVFGYVDYIVGDAADAKRITRLAIERAFRYRSTYNPKHGSATSWVFGVARYCLADNFHEPFATTGDELAQVSEDDAVFDDRNPQAVRVAVARLGPRDRELIALRYGADLTSHEIGEQLGLRSAAVESALRRALGRLRGVLNESFEPSGDAA
jgi:RNA polymerase sigma-70 factor (ECF subfamily)